MPSFMSFFSPFPSLSRRQTVAIKKCKDVFNSRALAKRTLREIKLLRLASRHANIVNASTIIQPTSLQFSDLYVVFEAMETDLAEIIRSSQELTDQHVHFFAKQIFTALQFLHSACIVHRDLKPRNLLINADCCLKVADFGLARVYAFNGNYVTTRWYRAPEIIVGWDCYGSSIDIWSTGLIVAEMLMRTPVLPGSTSEHQIYLILSLLGKPENSFIQQARKRCFRHLLSNSTEQYVTCKHTQFREHFPNASDGSLSLLVSCLSFDPKDRITAKEALLLPYFTNYNGIPYTTAITTQRSGGDDSCIDMEELKAEFGFEEHNLCVEELRSELLQEIQKYRGTSEMRGEDIGGEHKESASTPVAYTDGSSDEEDEEEEEDDGSMGIAIDDEMDTTGSVVMDIGGNPPCCYRPRGQEPGTTRSNNGRGETKSSIPSSSTNVHHKRTTVPPSFIPSLPSTFIASPITTKITSPRSTRHPLDVLQTTTPLSSTLNHHQQQHQQQQHQSSLAIETDGVTSSHQTLRQEGSNIIHSKQGGFGRTKIGQQQQQQQQQQEGSRQNRNKFQDFFHNICKQS